MSRGTNVNILEGSQTKMKNQMRKAKIFKEKGPRSGLRYPTGAFEERGIPNCNEEPGKPYQR